MSFYVKKTLLNIKNLRRNIQIFLGSFILFFVVILSCCALPHQPIWEKVRGKLETLITTFQSLGDPPLRLCRITANIGVTGGIIVLVINSWSNNTKNKKKLHESTPNIVARGFRQALDL